VTVKTTAPEKSSVQTPTHETQPIVTVKPLPTATTTTKTKTKVKVVSETATSPTTTPATPDVGNGQMSKDHLPTTTP